MIQSNFLYVIFFFGTLSSPLKTRFCKVWKSPVVLEAQYGLSAGYLRYKNSVQEVQTTINDLAPATVVEPKASLSSLKPQDLKTPSSSINPSEPRRNYGLSAGYLLSLKQSRLTCASKPQDTVEVPQHIASIKETLSVDSFPIAIEQPQIANISNLISTISTSTSITPVDEVTLSNPSFETNPYSSKFSLVTPEAQTTVASSTPPQIPVTGINYEQQIKTSAMKDLLQNERNIEDLNSFQSILSKSLSRKAEAENMIISELAELRPLIKQKLDIFVQRGAELEDMMKCLVTSKATKTEQIDEEKRLISKMIDIRGKITEKRILTEYDMALSKKTGLIEVDSALLTQLTNSLTRVDEAVSENAQKIGFLASKFQNFPSGSDRDSMLRYSWNDISEIQCILASETRKEWRDLDEHFKMLIESISSAERQRSAILEEQEELPGTKAKGATASSYSSDEDTTLSTVPITEAEIVIETHTKQLTSTSIQLYDPNIFRSLSVSLGRAVVKTPTNQMRSLVHDRGAKELAFMLGNVALVLANSVADITTSVVESTVAFTKSREAIETKKAADLTLNAAAKASESFLAAVESVQTAWSSSMDNGKTESTTDELLIKVVQASKNAFENDRLKSALDDAAKNLQQSVSEASLATGLAAGTVTENIKSSDKFNGASEGLLESVKFLAAFSAVAFIKLFQK